MECQPAALDAALLGAARHGFDLASELPLRATLFALSPGASLDPLVRDLAQAYATRSAGTTPAWPPLPVQYAAYSLAGPPAGRRR